MYKFEQAFNFCKIYFLSLERAQNGCVAFYLSQVRNEEVFGYNRSDSDYTIFVEYDGL